MADNVQIIGIGSLGKMFSQVKKDMAEKTSLRMVASAGGVLRTEAKRLALSQGLKKSGALIRNIAIKRERKAPPGVAQYNLGVRHGRHLGNGKKIIKFLALGKSGRVVIRRQNDPFYWWFLERGHKIIPRASSKRDGISIRRRSPIGFVEPSPFIQPALENKREEAMAAMEARLKRDIERYNSKT